MEHESVRVFTPGELGGAIRSARLAKGLRQDELVARLGVSRMTVSRLERGDSVAVDTAVRALSECGFALVVAPKISCVRLDQG